MKGNLHLPIFGLFSSLEKVKFPYLNDTPPVLKPVRSTMSNICLYNATHSPQLDVKLILLLLAHVEDRILSYPLSPFRAIGSLYCIICSLAFHVYFNSSVDKA